VVAVVGPDWEADRAADWVYDPRGELQDAAADGIPVVVVEIRSARESIALATLGGVAADDVAARVEQSLPTKSATVQVSAGSGFDRGIEDLLNAIRAFAALRGESNADKDQEVTEKPTENSSYGTGPWITLPERIPAAPGTTTSIELNVENTSPLIEPYELAVIGEAADWTDLVPKSVLVASSETFVLTFSTPWSLSLRGVSFGIQASTPEGLTFTAFSQIVRPPIMRTFDEWGADPVL
jgi:hypothetical protein